MSKTGNHGGFLGPILLISMMSKNPDTDSMLDIFKNGLLKYTIP